MPIQIHQLIQLLKNRVPKNQIILDYTDMTFINNAGVQQVMTILSQTTSKIIEGGSSILATPLLLLKNIHQSLMTYMILVIFILAILAFFYCLFSYFGNWKKINLSNNRLIKFVTNIIRNITIRNENITNRNEISP